MIIRPFLFKLLVFFLLICSCVEFSFAQKKFRLDFKNSLSICYRSQFGGMQPYKDVLTYYNQTRPWLSKEFAANAWTNGIELGFGSSSSKYGFSFLRLYYGWNTARAKGTNVNQDFSRKIQLRSFGIELFDIWMTPIHIGKFNLGGGIMPVGLNKITIKTQLNDIDKIRIPLTFSDGAFESYNFLLTSQMYTNFHIDITKVNANENGSFHFQLFYTLGPKTTHDLYSLNAEINPTTYPSFRETTQMKIRNFGFKLMFNF